MDQAIGLFLNSIPFRTTLTEAESWEALILRVHRQEAEFLPHRRYPMAEMKQIVNTTETLFESVFNFTHFHMLKELQSLPACKRWMSACVQRPSSCCALSSRKMLTLTSSTEFALSQQ